MLASDSVKVLNFGPRISEAKLLVSSSSIIIRRTRHQATYMVAQRVPPVATWGSVAKNASYAALSIVDFTVLAFKRL